MYQFYQVMICLLKFDLFVYLSVEVQVRITIVCDALSLNHNLDSSLYWCCSMEQPTLS